MRATLWIASALPRNDAVENVIVRFRKESWQFIILHTEDSAIAPLRNLCEKAVAIYNKALYFSILHY